MTLAYLTTPLLGLVDTAVVGQFGDAALLGGLAAGAIVFDVVFTTFNFLRSGTTGLVAQAFGRGDAAGGAGGVLARLRRSPWSRASLLALLAPLFAVAGQWFMGAEPRVNEAHGHLCPHPPARRAVLADQLRHPRLCARARRGRARPAAAARAQRRQHRALSILLGLELGWGVAGVAWGTVGGEFVAMLIGLAIVARRFRRRRRACRASSCSTRPAFGAMLSLNRDIMIRSFSLLAAFALFTRQGAQFGTVTLAANAVLMNFFLVAGYLPRRLRHRRRTACRPRRRRARRGRVPAARSG